MEACSKNVTSEQIPGKKGTNDEIIWEEEFHAEGKALRSQAVPGMFQEKSRDQYGWSRVTKGESCGRKRHKRGATLGGGLVGHGWELEASEGRHEQKKHEG